MADQAADSLAWRIEELYDWYGKPLEAEHMGEYLVVAGHGEFLFGPDEAMVATEALAKFGPGCWLFRVERMPSGSVRSARRLMRE